MSGIENILRRKATKASDADFRDEPESDPDRLTKIDVRNIVFFYGTAAVIFGNMLYDWAKSFH